MPARYQNTMWQRDEHLGLLSRVTRSSARHRSYLRPIPGEFANKPGMFFRHSLTNGTTKFHRQDVVYNRGVVSTALGLTWDHSCVTRASSPFHLILVHLRLDSPNV